jgi:RND family efflux transporter MFP subunit
MKKILMVFCAFVLLLQSCTDEKSNNLESKLKDLKTKRDALNEEITDLETKLGVNEVKNISVEALNLKKEKFVKYVNMQSVVYSDKNSNLSPKMGGIVTKINVEPGSSVSAGQVLLELDNSIQLKKLAEAKNRMEFIETIYNKQKSIWEKKVGSEIEYLKAKNDYESMKRGIALIEEEIDMLKLKAPFSGIIDIINAKVGEAIAPGLGVVLMSSNTGLEVRTEFPENYINNIRRGMDVVVEFPDLGIEPLNLKITSVSGSVDKKDRTLTAIIKLPSNIKDLRSNMTCVAKFSTYTAENTIVIPINLVQKSNESTYIYVVGKSKDGKTISQKREVKLGQNYNDKVEVLSGLNEGDQLITYGAEGVKDNSLIEVSQVVKNSNY